MSKNSVMSLLASKSRVLRGAVYVAVVVSIALIVRNSRTSSATTAVTQDISQLQGSRDGVEVNLILITSPTCGPSNNRSLPATVERIRVAVRDYAANRRQRFRYVGIVQDEVAFDGLAHLKKFGEFDTVITGPSSANLGINRYVKSVIPGPAATPQLVVTELHIGARDTSEKLLTRKVGLSEIKQWQQLGAPLPERQ